MQTFLAVLLGTLTANIILVAVAKYFERRRMRKEMDNWQRAKEEIEKTFNRVTGKKETRAEA